MEPLILAIDTSCDETSASVTYGRRVLSNVISSQINIHKKYGGVFPALAKRVHEEKIDWVINEALRRAIRVLKWEVRSVKLDDEVRSEKSEKIPFPTSISSFSSPISHLPFSAIAVTYGPGLAIALEVGIRKAKEIATGKWEVRSVKLDDEVRSEKSEKIPFPTSISSLPPPTSHLPLIAVNHMEGHIYSCLAQNACAKPEREIVFPALCLLVSGGHTELVLMKDHGKYQVLGSTLDDACGEALDKAAKILKLGYPGGPIIEQLSLQVIQSSKFKVQSSKFPLTPPLKAKNNLNFSYSGLKTQFLYLVNSLSEKEFNENLLELAFSFQSAAFEQLLRKTANAIKLYNPKTLLYGGGVLANKYLRTLLRKLAKENKLPVFFPANKKLIGDNAAMIGVAAYYKLQRGEVVKNIEELERIPKLSL